MGPSDPILTVAQMRAAEQALIDGGESIESLMERAGVGAADWVWRIAGGRPITLLCGPGNNGGDGYVIARELARRGARISVIAPLEPATEAAIEARRSFGELAVERGQGGVLVDCLFGSGLTRPLSPEFHALLSAEAERHAVRIAVDLPSGIDADSGKPLNEGLPRFDATLALGAWKFAHWLMPAMAAMGDRRLVPLGIGPVEAAAGLLQPARLRAPAVYAHKYTRGLVLVVAGPMAGAAWLASEAAMRAGAGTVRLAAPDTYPGGSPDVVLKPQPLPELLADERTGAVLVGPGLGRDKIARGKLREVLAANRPTVADADALILLDPKALAKFSAPLILTPHEGEFAHLVKSFGIKAAGKAAQTQALAKATGAVVIAKGPDTVIAAPDGRTVLAPSASSWLSVAGSGDVLAGVVASRLSTGAKPFSAACEAAWLHGEAARIAGQAFTASELAERVAEAYAAACGSGLRGGAVKDSEEVVRVAARGDGVTASGRHVPLAAPGDRLLADGTLAPGPHHAQPPCHHFGRCGGCQLQHLDEEAQAVFVRDRVLNAAEGLGLVPEKTASVHLSPPNTRRRATLRAVNGGGRPLIGFNEAGSHRVVDIRECHVLAPELFALIEPLRALLAPRRDRYGFEITLALTDQGVDCAIEGFELSGLEQTEAMLDFCREQQLARLTLDQGFGPEVFWEPELVTISLSGVKVDFPAGAFRQASADGEAALIMAAQDWLGDCARVADLFAGLGAFAFALAGTSRVVAAEAVRNTHLACRAAAGRARIQVEALHRDLFRNPLRVEELRGFDGVVLDPPRAGAREQVIQLAASRVPRIAYVSCNPSSWARDGRILVDAGYRLAEVRPVGQFLWSTHVELASLFVR